MADFRVCPCLCPLPRAARAGQLSLQLSLQLASETWDALLIRTSSANARAEVKHLKSLVRNIIDPSRDLGHTDRALRAANVPAQTQKPTRTESGASQDVNPGAAAAPGEKCEDCQ